MLTIAIPTYNRIEPLAVTVQALIPQLTPDCRLIIVDNASPIPVSDAIAPLLSTIRQCTVTVVRNCTNIGLGANIMRCMETCESEWLWVLGDDDIPRVNAVETILRLSALQPDCVFIHFSSALGQWAKDINTCGRTNFLRALDGHISDVLFLSTSVYNAKAIRLYLSYGYAQAGSFAPQTAVLLMALGAHGRTHWSREAIVHWGQPRRGDHWSYLWFSLGLPLLLDLPLTSSDRRLLGRAIRPHLAPPLTSYIETLCYALRTNDANVAYQIFRAMIARRAGLDYGMFSRVLHSALAASLRPISVTLPIVDAAYRAVRGTSLRSRSMSVPLDPDGRA